MEQRNVRIILAGKNMKNRAYLLNVLSLNERLYHQGLSYICDVRKQTLNTLSIVNEKKLSLGVELLLQYALKEQQLPYYGLCYDETGKPLLINQNEIHISLSHSGNYCACALSNDIVGIDVQEWIGATPLIPKRFFSKEEQQFLESLPLSKKEQAFYSLWCRKECLIKTFQNPNMKQLSTISCDENYIFYDYQFNRHSVAVFGKICNCPSSLEEVSIETLMRKLE